MFTKDAFITCVKVLGLLCVLALVLILLQRSETVQHAQDAEHTLSVQVVQLPQPWHEIVTLRCEDALVTSKEIKKLTCFLTNNSAKYLVAGSLDVSVVLDEHGTSSKQESLLSFDTFLHPDFREEHPQNLIPPGGAFRLQDTPSQFDASITKILASIDYVEFDDSSSIGPDRGGSNVVKGQRAGARKYKDWLAAKYDKARSLNDIIPLLNEDADLPPELKLTDSNEARGAKIFRTQERQLYETKGPEGLLRHLNAGRKIS